MYELSDNRKEAMNEDFTYIPGHMRDSFIMWIERGIYPGSFGTAVLENDLKQAFGSADSTNAHCLGSIVAWFYNYAPSQCWGSVENVKNWALAHEESRNENA